LIPVELRLTNFMSYKHMEEPISFSSIHTAVLCGPNGHGKSSLLDAITWSLWGQGRGVDKRGTGTDDLIHHKEPHMQVELTFDLEGQRYRVIRSRSRKGKTGVSRLEFQILDGGEPRSLTGETISTTQETINKTLRMDYETFVNSAFIMQGRADNFMAKSANERKEILSEILGLSVYDELEALAKEKRKELNDRLRIIDARDADIGQELERMPIYREEAERASGELAGAQVETMKAETGLAKLREKKAVFDMKVSQVKEMEERSRQVKSDISAIEDQLKSLEETVGRAKELIDKEGIINAAYDELFEMRKRDEDLTTTAQKHAAFESGVNEAKLKIAQARSALESEVEHLLRQKTELAKDLSRRPSVEAELAQVENELNELESIKRQVEEMRKRFSELRERKAVLEASIKAGKAKLVNDEKRLSLLSDGDACPLCKKPLNASERSTIDADINREIAEHKNLIESERIEKDSITSELANLESVGKSLSEKTKRGDSLQARKGKLETEMGAFKSAEENLSKIDKRLGEINLKLTQEAFATDEQTILRQLMSEIDKLGYDTGEHQKIKGRIKELAKYEQLKANLENAKQIVAANKVTIANLSAQKETKLKSAGENEAKARSLKEEIEPLENIQAALKQAEETLSERKRIEAAIIDRKTAAQVKLDNCTRLAGQKEALGKERKSVAKEVGIYDKLAFIFSKKGIQALIIENTIPEIEEEANVLLHRLTNGQMSLRFITQKDQKTGGVIETLDLIVTDGELGDRKYELFSGGEAFRINFAVRIALSKLLARRAGARLETLVVDEGFGTQDEEGKERLIEAITEVQNDFKKIIVITHLEDLKELFPARIEVVKKRGAGSIATVL